MGYNAVVAEHKASGQKLIVVDSGTKTIITAKDLEADNVEEKVKNIIKKVKYQAISVEDIAITKKGQINSYGKSSPYIRFEAKIKKFPIGDIAGIVSVAQTDDGEERILISVNERDKYSHLISEEFFKKIK